LREDDAGFFVLGFDFSIRTMAAELSVTVPAMDDVPSCAKEEGTSETLQPKVEK